MNSVQCFISNDEADVSENFYHNEDMWQGYLCIF